MYPVKEMKTLRIILYTILVILLILLLTHKLWVDSVVYYMVAHFYGVPVADLW
ncbi:MAG: hypothetical protein UW01_C0007G0040 [Candidatus Nomurabacteria bacterium GW2011_GWA2_43_66]|uniref:Uncharacterized protein n=1 Tax=Candidatus Nomurabacteria bacterium GW2011_GWF2_43_24 TaxID=1618778 RepID=A0A0G1GVF2_9BACT|nr:MAG: hypothetical protein UV13_C0002G0003 [Parcubacteria group bacterium GW2011_GWC1_42_21]KKS58646.1 MAG: hypothetical protein UV23_C0003G0030 [Candidatus Nomurabacteria bacterium GW2011_GWF1_42_40]KKT00409.1 MAG: hypothetical protein UV77_C0004G0041 [Candidatus Nomurabacteria bacterium GW2011_GWA1_43_17]KKT11362.1 MAG: hypothetical protein UV91_C0007G0062 [Candidatus Nomurabacteria bacterium GW2011_GWF2_43_24]KKT17942.1 MAG: hypothetical protein UW01_C0007G0040 [Candidatus Nomurabacteria b